MPCCHSCPFSGSWMYFRLILHVTIAYITSLWCYTRLCYDVIQGSSLKIWCLTTLGPVVIVTTMVIEVPVLPLVSL